jgi:hypothetical protein
MEQQARSRWTKGLIIAVGLVGLVLIMMLTRGCNVEHLGQWTKAASAEPSPSPRSGQALVYDEFGGRVIMFGGLYVASPEGEASYLDDTWAYDPSAGTWTELQPAGATPPARFGHAMVYDPDTGTVLMFGGYNKATEAGESGAGLNDLWEYDPAAGTWTELLPQGDGPPGWVHQVMVYASRNKGLLLLGTRKEPATGGETTPFKYVNELWAYDRQADAWTKLEPAGERPPGLTAESLAYDPNTGQVLVAGGYFTSLEGSKPDGEFALIFNERLWAYDPAKKAWADLNPGGEHPPGIEMPYFLYHPATQRFILVAQGLSADYDRIALMYSFDSVTNRWIHIAPTDEVYPDVRLAGSILWCPDQQVIMLYGGYVLEGLENAESTDLSYVHPDGVWFYSTPAATGEQP